MLKKYLTKVLVESYGLTTYSLGLLQAKAYRILKNHTTETLKVFNISTVEWALLGLLYETKEGVGITILAELLGVEVPFVTTLIDSLEKKKLVERHFSKEDKRYKTVHLTVEGIGLLPNIEEVLKKKTKPLFAGLGIKDVFAYQKVLKSIIDNSQKLE